jgi:hypothetical protein
MAQQSGNKMKLADYLRAIGLNSYLAAQHIEHMSGVKVTKELLEDIMNENRRREETPPIVAKPKADAICKFLSEELGRPITIGDIKGLEVC